MPRVLKKKVLREFYNRLFQAFGKQNWWPGESAFEIIIGAMLTQNTNWSNVEKAICNLKKQNLLTPQKLHALSHACLAKLIKPAGYFNLKAKRIQNFLVYFFKTYNGNISSMKRQRISRLREELLSVNGIGPETADSILLYALGKPVFVVDAYTKRFLSRHAIIDENSDYYDIQRLFMENVSNDRQLFNEYHALIVRLGKDYCRPKPRCESCSLRNTHFPNKMKV